GPAQLTVETSAPTMASSVATRARNPLLWCTVVMASSEAQPGIAAPGNPAALGEWADQRRGS
ncbi:MAG: hypothetical protein WBW80_10755, partial [Acidimicrobiales bacterium]